MAKTALITGSTSGIGLGIAKLFAAHGYNIAFNGLEANGAALAQEVAEAHGIKYTFSPANLMDAKAIVQMVGQALDAFGSIEVLINNAGIQFVSALEDFPEEKWDAIISVNLTAAFHVTKALWPQMKKSGFGRVINIASAHGLRASAFKSAYVAAKHGLVGFTKTIALEGAPFGITANAICPGYVETPLIAQQIPAQAKAHHMSESEVVEKVILERHAVKQFVPVDLIAQTALFLASDDAGTLTGTAIPVDAGWTAQ